MDKSSNSDLSTSFRGQKISNAALSSELSVGTPCANALADSLGVSPLYRQIEWVFCLYFYMFYAL
jgi:hypothetical protein